MHFSLGFLGIKTTGVPSYFGTPKTADEFREKATLAPFSRRRRTPRHTLLSRLGTRPRLHTQAFPAGPGMAPMFKLTTREIFGIFGRDRWTHRRRVRESYQVHRTRPCTILPQRTNLEQKVPGQEKNDGIGTNNPSLATSALPWAFRTCIRYLFAHSETGKGQRLALLPLILIPAFLSLSAGLHVPFTPGISLV